MCLNNCNFINDVAINASGHIHLFLFVTLWDSEKLNAPIYIRLTLVFECLPLNVFMFTWINNLILSPWNISYAMQNHFIRSPKKTKNYELNKYNWRWHHWRDRNTIITDAGAEEFSDCLRFRSLPLVSLIIISDVDQPTISYGRNGMCRFCIFLFLVDFLIHSRALLNHMRHTNHLVNSKTQKKKRRRICASINVIHQIKSLVWLVCQTNFHFLDKIFSLARFFSWQTHSSVNYPPYGRFC